MRTVAIAWQIYLLTDSPLAVGLIGLLTAIPFIGFSLVGGAVADLASRRRILLATLLGLAVLSGVLAWATATDVIAPWMIYSVAFASGGVMAFHHPTLLALIPNMVPRGELPRALTLSTLIRNLAAIAGPGIGGLAMGHVGVAAAYVLSIGLFMVATGAAVLIRSEGAGTRQRAVNSLELVLGGLRHAHRQPLVLSVLTMDFSVTLVGSARALLPVFARDVLVVGAGGLGLLHAAISAGAVVGGMVLSSFRIGRPTALMLLAASAQGLFLIGFGVSSVLAISMTMLFAMGAANCIAEVARIVIVQLRTPDDLRGRVMALSMMFSGGSPYLGQVQSGAMASALGPVAAAVIGGVGVVLIVAGFSRLPPLRRDVGESIAEVHPE